MRINKKLLIIAPIIIVIAVPLVVMAKFSFDCGSQRSSEKSEKQSQIDEFNKVMILPNQPAKKSRLLSYGDCVDSKPGVGAAKNYKVTMNGAEAVDSVRSGLKSSGYTITNENFGREGCKLLWRVQARNDAIQIYVVAYQKDLKDPSCTDGHGVGIQEEYFRRQNIDHVDANLKV